VAHEVVGVLQPAGARLPAVIARLRVAAHHEDGADAGEERGV